MKLLANKIALITGGSRGIGATMVKNFAEQGAHVAFTYRSSTEQANHLVEPASAHGTTLKTLSPDASSF